MPLSATQLNMAVLLALLVFAGVSSAANAQQSTVAASPAGLEEIVVTARRRSEDLQVVPLAIDVFSADDIERLNFVRLSDVASQTPNLTFVSGESGRLNTPIIRGMAMIDSRGFDNNVGVFVDGVYVSGRAAQDITLLDLERIEVVKGPQSALYGRNTFAGAINFVSKRPTDTFASDIELTLGEDELQRFQGAISGPIVADKLFGRLSAGYLSDDGTYENSGPAAAGSGIDGFENKAVNATLLYTPSDSSEIFLDLYWGEDFRDSRALRVVPNTCGEIVPTRTSLSYDVGQPYYACGETPAFGGNELSLSPEAYSSDGETSKIALRMKFDLGSTTLSSITAFTENTSVGLADLDRSQTGAAHYGYADRAFYEFQGSPPVIFPDAPFIPGFVPVTDANFNTYIGSQGLDQEYWSQELRLDSSGSERLRWSAGLFYFDAENHQSSDLAIDVSSAVADSGLSPDQLVFMLVDPFGAGPLGRLALPHPLLAQPGDITTDLWSNNIPRVDQFTLSIESSKQVSAFASVDYDITDKLTMSAELRWTKETRSLEDIKDEFFFTVPPGQTNFFEVDHDWVDPRFTLRYTPNDTSMYYFSAAHGTRSGGVNGNTRSVDADILTFDPEENWTYEFGGKISWADQKFQLNAAVFHVDWSDAQFRQRLTDSLGSFLTATSNATGLTINGFELSFVARPTENFEITLGYGYNDASFDDGTLYSGGAALCALADPATSAYPGLGANCVADPEGSGAFFPDISGLQPRRSSDQTANLALLYSRPINANLSWFAAADASYRSKQFMDEINNAYVPDRVISNLSAGISGERYDLTLWVKNAFDEDAPEFAQLFQSDLNSFRPVTSIVGIPRRRVGLTARFRF
jgi:iron complex outermembrane receptor protein